MYTKLLLNVTNSKYSMKLAGWVTCKRGKLESYNSLCPGINKDFERNILNTDYLKREITIYCKFNKDRKLCNVSYSNVLAL